MKTISRLAKWSVILAALTWSTVSPISSASAQSDVSAPSKAHTAAESQELVDKIIHDSLSYWGTPYVYGATRFQDQSFDCSSFVQYLFSQYGVQLGWNAREQARQGEWIPFSEMKKGDLMFFSDEDFPNEQGLNKVRHVGIYMGNGKILHTYEEGIGVTVSDIKNDAREKNYWYEHFLFAKRVI